MKLFLVFLVGIIGGFINTLAGSGSVLILPLLIFSGLDPITANGTLRIGILFQSITAVSQFKKNKLFSPSETLPIVIPAIIGAIIGSFTAVNINKQLMNYAIAFILILMLFLLIFKPDKWINQSNDEKKSFSYPIKFIVFLIVGFYGGFIQAGVGFFLISALVFIAGYELVKANAIKMFIVMLYTPVALLIFALNKNVDILTGIILASGMIIGAFVAAKTAIKKGSPIIRIFLIIAIIISTIKLLFF